MRIGRQEIGLDQPPYVIAEIGVNHDGSVDRALELVHAAAGAGADAIKLQLFKTDLLMSEASRLASYQEDAGETDPLAMLRRLELSIEQMKPIVSLAYELGIGAIVTVFSVELIEEAEQLNIDGQGWSAYKTASPDITNKPLLDALVATGRPLIISTGASTLDEVSRSIQWLEPAHERTAYLQCVSCYPTPADSSALGGIKAINRVFNGPVGYSDHTQEIQTGWMAVACGATLLEKHLTYDTKASGPDHAASLEPDAFRDYCTQAKLRQAKPSNVEQYTPGAPVAAPVDFAMKYVPKIEKVVLPIEEDVRVVSRQSLTNVRDMPAGYVLKSTDLTIKRPGTGIEPWRMAEMVGRVMRCQVQADRPLREDDLEEQV